MKWEALTTGNVVSLLASACEHATMDFKEMYDVTNATTDFEIAKDVTAFANHIGGTIVVGAVEGRGADRGKIVRLAPLLNPAPGALAQVIERAVRLYCLPVPLVDTVEISLDASQATQVLGRSAVATSIVAINVAPSINTPIGCATCASDGKKIADAYRFPLRTLTGTRFLRPEELPKVMNVVERRALLELQALMSEAMINVWFNDQTGVRRSQQSCRIDLVDADIMICRLSLVRVPSAPAAEIPLTFVRACWRSSEGWNVAIDGIAFEGAGEQRAGFFPPGAGPA